MHITALCLESLQVTCLGRCVHAFGRATSEKVITFFLQDFESHCHGPGCGFVRVLPDDYVKGCGDGSVVKMLAMQARKPEFR